MGHPRAMSPARRGSVARPQAGRGSGKSAARWIASAVPMLGVERRGQDAGHVACGSLADHGEALGEARPQRLDDDGVNRLGIEKGAKVGRRAAGLVGGDGDGGGGADAGEALGASGPDATGCSQRATPWTACAARAVTASSSLQAPLASMRSSASGPMAARTARSRSPSRSAGAPDLDLHSPETARHGGLGLAGEVVRQGRAQERVHWHRDGSGRGEAGLIREPVGEGSAARPREEGGERGLDGDVGTGEGIAGEGAPGLVGRPPDECAAHFGDAPLECGGTQAFPGEGRALAEAGGAVRGLDADDEALAFGQVARAGGEGVTQGDAPGPPAHARDGAGGGHGRRGNLAMSE